MTINDYLGKPKTVVEDISRGDIVAINNVNGTIEVKGIEVPFSKKTCHAIFYFDLIDNRIMNMAILKVERVSLLNRLKIKARGDFQCGEYIGTSSLRRRKEVIFTYVRENILKAL